MKKVICFVALVIVVISLFCGCNMQMIDLTYAFDRAIISLPNGEVVEG